MLQKNFPPNLTFLSTYLFVKDQKTLLLSEDNEKETRVIALPRLARTNILLPLLSIELRSYGKAKSVYPKSTSSTRLNFMQQNRVMRCLRFYQFQF